MGTIRNEIASCWEKAYASLPVSNAKNLIFLDSEGAVIQFAKAVSSPHSALQTSLMVFNRKAGRLGMGGFTFRLKRPRRRGSLVEPSLRTLLAMLTNLKQLYRWLSPLPSRVCRLLVVLHL